MLLEQIKLRLVRVEKGDFTEIADADGPDYALFVQADRISDVSSTGASGSGQWI